MLQRVPMIELLKYGMFHHFHPIGLLLQNIHIHQLFIPWNGLLCRYNPVFFGAFCLCVCVALLF